MRQYSDRDLLNVAETKKPRDQTTDPLTEIDTAPERAYAATGRQELGRSKSPISEYPNRRFVTKIVTAREIWVTIANQI